MNEVTFWISFADSQLPRGQQFLGAVVVVVARDGGCDPVRRHVGAIAVVRWLAGEGISDEEVMFTLALGETRAHGVNPGGSARGRVIPDEVACRIPPPYVGRLLDRNQIFALEALLDADGVS